MTSAAPPRTPSRTAPPPTPAVGGPPTAGQALSRTGIAVLVVAGAVAVSLLLGSNAIGPGAVLERLLHPALDEGAIVWGSRVPRTVLGLLVGAALGIAGAVMQGQTRNPLADPGIFGVSAGASLAVVLGVYVAGVTSVLGILWMSFLGAVVASVAVFAIAALGRSLSSPVPLAIAGTAVTALLSAITSFLVLTDQSTLAAYRIWVVGSLSGRTLEGIGPAIAMALAGLVLAAANIRSLDMLALGGELAQGLGENILRARLVGLGAITLLTASAVALSGPIGFIGLTAPHIARAMVGAGHGRLLPVAGLVGAGVLLLSDVIGRLIGGTGEVSVGVVLTVLGGIVFVMIVRRSRMAAL